MLLLHAYRKTAIHRCISTQQCIRPLSTASQMAPVEIATSRAPTPRRIVPSRRGRRLSSRRVPMEATLDAVVVDRAGSSTSTMNALADDIPSEMRRLMQAGADMRQWCRPMASLSSSAGPSSSVLLDLSTSGSSSIGSILGHGNGNSGNGSNSGPPGSTNLHTLRCSILTATGDIHTAARDIAKTELCARFALMQRDLRKLDSRFRHQLPAILVRPRAVLVNLGAIKAIIMHDQLILIESQDKSQSYECARLLYELSGQLKRMSTATTATSLNSPPTGATSAHTDDDDNYEDGQPFEFQMMEVLLARTIHALRAESESLLPAIEHFLSAQVSVHDVRKETLTSLLHYNKLLTTLQGRVSSVRATITEVLNSDEDLSNFYLTEKQRGIHRPVTEHEEAEILMETYLKEADEILSRTQQLEENIQSTEDIINISLDSQRNAILFMEVRLAMGTFAVANGALVSSIFGMNLWTGWESSGAAFVGVSAVALGVSASVFSVLRRRLGALVRR